MEDDYDLLELPIPATASTTPTTRSAKSPYNQQQVIQHHQSDDERWSFFVAVLSATIAALVAVLALKLNTIAQASTSWVVDVDKCTCDCWDRAFKGNYGHGGYKHVYFQMTKGTIILWLWSAAHFVMLLKFVERATACVLGSIFRFRSMPRVRWPVLFLSCINFYGMFYNWWITFNYINDAGLHEAYHILLPTQVFFDLTDVIPAITLYHLLPANTDHGHSHSERLTNRPPKTSIPHSQASPTLLFAALTVSSSHLILSLLDQGFLHLLTLGGAVLRDFMFVLSDLAAVLVVGWFIRPRLRRSGAQARLVFAVAALTSSYLVLKRWAGYSDDY